MAGVRDASADRIVTASREQVLTQTLGDVLGGVGGGGTRWTQALAIPVLQRRYCWGHKQLSRLLADLGLTASGAFRRREGMHSLGRVVLSRDSRTVLDGQQRLTTSCLILAAIRWEMPALAERVEGMLFAHRTNGGDGGEDEVGVEELVREEGRVAPGAAVVPTWLDRRAFWRCLLVPPGSPFQGEKADGDDCVSQAFDFVRDRLSAVADSDRDRVLPALLDTLLKRTTVLHFQIRESDVFSVYERLAFRECMLSTHMYNPAAGISLGESDLVRNYLLSFFVDLDERRLLEVYHTLWVPFEKAAGADREGGVDARGGTVQPGEQGRRADVARMNAIFTHQLNHSVGAQRQAAANGPASNVGGALHLFEYPDYIFPVYRKVRAALEGSLLSQGLPLSPHAAPDRSSLDAAVSTWMRTHLNTMLKAT